MQVELEAVQVKNDELCETNREQSLKMAALEAELADAKQKVAAYEQAEAEADASEPDPRKRLPLLEAPAVCLSTVLCSLQDGTVVCAGIL